MTDAESATDEGGATCSIRPALDRLTRSIERLVSLLQPAALEADLRKITLMNPVQHDGVTLSAEDAGVVERLTTLARAVPLSRLHPREVNALARLERAGFVSVEGRVIQVTARGRALGALRARQRKAARTAVEEFRRTIDDLSCE